MYCYPGYEWVFTTAMRVNMIDTGEAIEVLVTLPGAKKEAIQVSLKDEFINVKVEADKVSKEDAGEAPHYLWREFKEDGFERDILVGKHLKQDSISASYDNGILTITVQKEMPQKVTVK